MGMARARLSRRKAAAPSLPPEPESVRLDCDMGILNQDILMLVIGRHTIDVGWYPDCDPNGKFVCRVIQRMKQRPRAEDWIEGEIVKFETRDPAMVMGWLNARIVEYTALASGRAYVVPVRRHRPGSANGPAGDRMRACPPPRPKRPQARSA